MNHFVLYKARIKGGSVFIPSFYDNEDIWFKCKESSWLTMLLATLYKGLSSLAF